MEKYKTLLFVFLQQNPKTSYKAYGREALLRALDEVKSGGHIRKISRKYGVPRATLPLIKKLGNVSSSQPHNKLLSPPEEE